MSFESVALALRRAGLRGVIVKKSTRDKAVILNLDQHAGQLRLDERNGCPILVGVDLVPGTAAALREFKQLGVKVGLLVAQELPAETLRVLKKLIPGVNLVVRRGRSLERTLTSCCRQLETSPGRTTLVAADRMLRAVARKNRHPAWPHPIMAVWAMKDGSPRFVKVTGSRQAFDRLTEMLPYFLERKCPDSWTLLGVASKIGVTEAIGCRLQVEALPLDVSTDDAVMVDLDCCDEHQAAKLRKMRVLASDGRRLLLALRAGEYSDAIGSHGRHGHTQSLAPRPELLIRPPRSKHHLYSVEHDLARFPLEKVDIREYQIDWELYPTLYVCPSASSIQSDVDRYSGVANLDGSGPVVSRHSRHPDNARVVQALLGDLTAMGYCPYTHDFEFEGATLKNVIADLPGRGYFAINPDIVNRLREIFIRYPIPWPPDPWLKEVVRLTGKKWQKEHGLDRLEPLQLRWELERIMKLEPWYPWWRRLCPFAGFGAQIVIVGCHLDSTAASDGGYNASVDPAPGADDDASGIAGTLAVARRLADFSGNLTHTVRFCFFNAEESGLVGSKAYSSWMKSFGAPIRAAVCMDMIGYNSDDAHQFEVHAGYYDADVRDESVPIAESIADWAVTLGALAPAQIYKGTSDAAGTDRDLYDGAINRSDHAAFHQQGYPAVVVSEDFFANLASEPGADPNPNYHRLADTTIDSAYAANIVCAVTHAVRGLASG